MKMKLNLGKKALWVKAFPEQAKALRTERSKAGGIKKQSAERAVLMAIYKPIKAQFLREHRLCVACPQFGRVNTTRYQATQVHHLRGRDGLLLLDIRYWLAVCETCHTFIHANPEWARENGLLAAKGDWGKQGA